MLFNHLRVGWEKIMTSQAKDVYVELMKGDKSLQQVMAATGLEEMPALRILSKLESDLGLVETRVDSSMGSDRFVFMAKYTASELRQLIARRLLRSMIDEFGQDLLEVVIEELQARPAAAQAVRDALNGS